MIPFLSSLLVRLRQVQVFLRAFEWHQRRLRLGLGQQRGNRPRLLRQEGPGNFRVDQSARWLRPRPSRLRRDVLKNKKSFFGVVKHLRCCKQWFGYGSQKWALFCGQWKLMKKFEFSLGEEEMDIWTIHLFTLDQKTNVQICFRVKKNYIWSKLLKTSSLDRPTD